MGTNGPAACDDGAHWGANSLETLGRQSWPWAKPAAPNRHTDSNTKAARQRMIDILSN
jgi:hypothetical protein